MDPYVEMKLKDWGLFEKLQESFNRNEIDEEIFKALNDNDIAELIPCLGIRKKFLKNFFPIREIVNAAKEQPILLSDHDSIDNLSTSTISVSDSGNSQSNFLSDLEENTSTDGLVRGIIYAKKATIDVPYIISTYNNSVRKLLDKCEDGKIIKASYGPNKKFLRSKLCELLIKEELKSSVDKKISSRRFQELASEINDVFFHEEHEVYYVPYVNRINGKPKAARGKLWSTYCYMRKNLKSLGLLPSTSRVSTHQEKHNSEFDDANTAEDLQWLKNNCFPLTTVEQKWKSTTHVRLAELKTIAEYFKLYRCLLQPAGYLLLEVDFCNLFENKETNLLTKWPTIYNFILQIASKRKDGYLNSVREAYTSKQETNETTDQIFALTILPLLFNCVLKCKSGKQHWRPSKPEIRNGFLLHLKDISQLETELEARARKYATFNLTAQPIPIIIGNWNNIEECYVCINNNVRYKVETPLKAVDLCFKIYHALNAEYPKEADSVWTFLQLYVYEIKTQRDNRYVSVGSLISDLNALLNTTTAE